MAIQGAGIMNQSDSNVHSLVLPPQGLSSRQQQEIPNKVRSIRKYEMSNNSTEIVLDVKGKDLKYLTINMLNMNLVHVNIAKNKITKLPEEIC